jgi:23S rRNA (adenine2030-N6)-methyltransferase
MLSYQHAYHAGNPADLHKHIVLAELLTRLTVKPRPLTYLETHAARALYDLHSPEALNTGEAAAGIGRIELDPASPYGRTVLSVRERAGASAYPGSPLIAQSLLRSQDRLIVMELHPAEHAALKQNLWGPNVEIHRRDGFEGALALSPPVPRRGLVLVDPSYEVKSDYADVAAFARRLIARWPQAVMLIWYPILDAARHGVLKDGLAPLPHLIDEVGFVPRPAVGMTGSGLALINAPYGSAQVFAEARRQAGGVLAPAVTRAGRR